MALKTISIQLDEDLLERIKQLAGDVPRQRFIGRLLRETVEDHWPASGELVVEDDRMPVGSAAVLDELKVTSIQMTSDSPNPPFEASIDDWGGVGKRPPHPKRSKR